jgi:hypothetical protein
MSRLALILICFIGLAIPDYALAARSIDSPVLDPARFRATLGGGVARLSSDLFFDFDARLEVGIGPGIEIATPLALGVRLVGTADGSSLYLGLGIVDFAVTSSAQLLFAPAVALAGKARLGPESALLLAFDITGVEEGVLRRDHPFWLRGSLAVAIDVGKWVSIFYGIAYQRRASDGTPPLKFAEPGWVSDSRISFGSVRAQPFGDIPVLAIHVFPSTDFVFMTRADIDPERRTTDLRALVGLEHTR